MLLQGNYFILLLLSLSGISNAGIRTCLLLLKMNTIVRRYRLDVKGTDCESLAGEGEMFG